MKRRTARKIFQRLSEDATARQRYKASTLARAFTAVVGVECRPKDADAAVFAIIFSSYCMEHHPYLVKAYAEQSNLELAS